MRNLPNYFLSGLLVVAPIALTIYILIAAFTWLDHLFYVEGVPGLGLLLLAALITSIGFLATSFLVRPWLTITQRMLHRMPLVGIIYSSIKDLFAAFVGDNQKFNRPVLVRINAELPAYRMGFATQENIVALDQPHLVAVYYPHSYNFSGELQLVPVESITYLNISSSEAMKFIVSGGVSSIRGVPVPRESESNDARVG